MLNPTNRGKFLYTKKYKTLMTQIKDNLNK